MIKKLTSIAMMAMLSLGSAWADNGEFDAYFKTLPTEQGKGVVTSLNYNNNWLAFLGAPGSTLGKCTWGRFNNPWGGNGRVWLECVDAENSLYVLAGQGRYLGGFSDNGDGTALSITTLEGEKDKALRFKVVEDETTPGEYHFIYTDGAGEQWWIQALNNRTNSLGAKKAVEGEADASTWKLGTWQGVGFARLDVKTWDGAPEGGNAIKKCEDGYYYGTLCLPFDVQIPASNQFPDGTDVPSMQYGADIVNVWSFSGEGTDLQVHQLKAGDVVTAGNCILVRATATNVDFLIAPGSQYVDKPSEEQLFTGYYVEPPYDEVFHLHIDDGYPKFTRSKIQIDETYGPITYTGYDGNVNATTEVIEKIDGGNRQIAVNIGYIVANRSNRPYLEYRFDFENNTIAAYENPDYQRMAQVKFASWLKPENVGGPFQINPADTTELRSLLTAFVGDKTEEEYNALAAEFLKHVVKPDQAFTAIKNAGGQYMGDRNQTDKVGMYADFGTPNGANGRAYLKKVDDTHYQLGFNGLWLQAPVAGEQVEKGEEPATFEIIISEPGKFALINNEVALAKDGMLKGLALSKDEETGEYTFSNATLWTIDTGYSDIVRADANTQFEGLRYGTVCMPYAVKADNEKDQDAVLYTVLYNDDDDLVLTEVDQLEAGQPGIIAGSASPVQLKIVGGYVSKPIMPSGDFALNGVLSVLPEEGAYQNPHTLGVITTTEIVGEDEDAQYVTTSKLGLVMGNYDINQAFWEGGANADEVALVMPDVKWDRQAERELGGFLADNKVGGAFQIPADKVDAFKLKIAQVKSEEDFNALKQEMTASVSKPETFYGALKNTQFMGDRNQTDVSGLYTNFNTPNGANGRAYLKKVDDTHYQLGFNGQYVQAPVAGEQATKGSEPVSFDLTVVEPGKIALSVDGVYLVAATTLQGGSLGATAEWTIDNAYTDIIRQDAKYKAGDLQFGAITMPYTVKVDLEADKAAALYTVKYNSEEKTLEMTNVKELPAGVPGIVAGANTPVLLQIVGGYVTEAAAPADGQALNGILSVKPGDYDFDNPLFLNVNGAGELVMDQINWYDINQAFFNCPDISASEVKFVNLPTQADNEANGISDLTIQKTVRTGAVYNLSGQKVSKNFRGIIIIDGKKFMNK